MKRIVLRNGLISGGITAVLMLIMTLVMQGLDSVNHMWGMVVGFANMLLALSLVYFGVRQYREQENGGKLTFLEGLKISLLIGSITVVFYVVSWLIYHQIFMPDFATNYVDAQIAQMQSMGLEGAELTKYETEMRSWVTKYDNNIAYRIYATAMEIFPVMLLVSLITALILRRKTPKQDVAIA